MQGGAGTVSQGLELKWKKQNQQQQKGVFDWTQLRWLEKVERVSVRVQRQQRAGRGCVRESRGGQQDTAGSRFSAAVQNFAALQFQCPCLRVT